MNHERARSRDEYTDAVASFSAPKPEEQTYFLAHFAHWLTVVACDAYEAGGNGLNDPTQVRASTRFSIARPDISLPY
jgi:hypothetical protein